MIVYSSVYSGTDQWTHKSSASLAFVQGIHRWPVKSLHKWPVMRKMFPFDDIIMGLVTHTCQRIWLSLVQVMACHQWWLNVKWIPTNKLQWNLNSNRNLFFQEHVSKMSSANGVLIHNLQFIWKCCSSMSEVMPRANMPHVGRQSCQVKERAFSRKS